MADDSQYDDSALPVSAGKLKQLWDAIRTTPVPPLGAPAAPTVAPADQGGAVAPPPPPAGVVAPPVVPGGPPTMTPPPPPPNVAATPAGPVTLPGGTGPLPGTSTTGTPLALAVANAQAAGAAGPPPSTNVDRMADNNGPSTTPLTLSQTPAVMMAPPTQEQTPANKRVAQLEAQVDATNKPATLIQKLLGFLPVAASIGAATIGKGAGGQSFVQGVPAAQEANLAQQNLNRKNLTEQLGAAESEREKEFDTAQRVQEQANAAMENSRTRDAIARQLGASRETVATTNAGARRDVAGITTAGRGDVAAGQNASRERIAQTAAAARIAAGKYAADAAANRQTRSLSAAASRQQTGFNHTDTKPTGDEDRRADLSMVASNLLDDIEERTGRRPELIGKFAGRLTTIRGKVGSDDPDITALDADKEALGQVLLGAHAMRNAGHIGVAANSVVNAWNSGPEGMKSAIDQARKNLGQMQTITRPTLASRATGAPASSASASKPSAKPTGDLQWTPGKGIH